MHQQQQDNQQQANQEEQAAPSASAPSLHPAQSHSSLASSASNTNTASTVSTAQEEVKDLITGFVSNLNATLNRNGMSEMTLVEPAMTTAPQADVSSSQSTASSVADGIHPNIKCDHCNELIKGLRYKVCTTFDSLVLGMTRQ